MSLRTEIELAPPRAADAATLRISEVFISLQGESRSVGCPTVFVRLTGCPLRCQYCDSAYAFQGGSRRPITELVDEVLAYRVRHVTVTGGEPLAQKRCLELLERLCDRGLEVSLETSGAMDVADVDPRVIKVMDIKTPASGEQGRNRWENLGHLQPGDQIKFVLCDRADYLWANEQLQHRRLAEISEVLYSPSWGQLDPTALADWIVADRLPVRFQLQLHKILWGDVPGR